MLMRMAELAVGFVFAAIECHRDSLTKGRVCYALNACSHRITVGRFEHSVLYDNRTTDTSVNTQQTQWLPYTPSTSRKA